MRTFSSTPPVTHDGTDRIGPYRLLQVLGEGGMGIVYEAEETEPVRRRVALKVLKDRHASSAVVTRFAVERQALAVMNHPGIAKVLNAGTTESGQPYFAMELVRGLPITQFCDEHRLGVPERLELFIAVCNAVQHAHQKGLIHRDLKPSNILIADVEGHPTPVIIDFGIAKALGQQLTDRTLVTEIGHALGTAAYMSPEQAESGNLDVDTRADIYSLGVVLFEVLVGQLPLDPGEIGIHVFLSRLISREIAPPAASTRLRTGTHDREAAARSRSTDVEHLRRALRGDLDCIVIKAMEPDRNRRYQTVNALVTDIQRHLANEPIIARPPSTAYRVGKFVRRHRGATIGGIVALVLIVASSLVTTVGMLRAISAERRAEEEAATAREATSVLEQIFRMSMPSARGDAVTARELLDNGTRLAGTLDDRPLLQGTVLQIIGNGYASLALYDESRRTLEDALAARERALPAGDTLIVQTLVRLGDVAAQKGELEDADRYLGRATTIAEARRPPLDSELGVLRSSLASVRMDQGRLAEAESLYALALQTHERDPATDRQRFARDLMGLAAVRLSQGRYADAEPLLRRAAETQERMLGPDHIQLAATLNNLGIVYFELGRYADALPLYERTRRIFERALPPEHPHVASSLNNLAETYWKLGRLAAAEPLFRQALAIKTQTLAPTAPTIATTLNGLAGVLRDRGQYAEAEPLYRRALDIRRQSLGEDHPRTGETKRDYAELLKRTGRAGAEGPALLP